MTMTTPISAMTERFVPVMRLMEYQNRLAWATTETMMRFAMMPWQGFTSKAGFGSICAPAGVQRKALETVEETTAKVAETVEETVAAVTATTEANAEKVAETAAEMTAETVEAAGAEAETAIAAVKPKGLDAPRGGTADDLKQLEGVGPKLEEAINATLPLAKYETPAALMILDLDNFTRAAERLGALAGDTLLKSAAQRMTAALEALEGPVHNALKDAQLAAMQADNFALYLPNAVSRDAVSNIARAIRLAFSDPFVVAGQPVSLGISGGIVIAPEDADSIQKLFRHAELALRQVRSDAGSGFRYFSPRLNRVARGKYMLEAELREAVSNREFKTHFQPKIDFQTGKVVGAEALARWVRPNGKIISPNTFIPLAEETGLVAQIGEQVLEAACRSARAWLNEGFEATVAVNVSPRQFQMTDLTEVVLGILKRTGLPPNRLELEITESMAVAEPDKVARVMRPLRSLGTKLAIDDFGTGHSNLSILTQLPFDVFKIDRQFVSALETDEQAPAIVEMILAMAETLGLKTVAEGVETERQADFLRRRGCSMAQGFLYSAGLPHEAFLDFLRSWSAQSGEAKRRAG